MLSRPTHRRRAKVLAAALAALALLGVCAAVWVVPWVQRQWRIDDCLDGGGRWVDEESRCERGEQGDDPVTDTPVDGAPAPVDEDRRARGSVIGGECPDDLPDCVLMTLSAPVGGARLLSQAPAGRPGFTLFRVRVDTASEGSTSLGVVGYTDGIHCSEFGQARAAVVRFTERREPVVLTSTGPVTIAGGLVVGCPDCAQVVDRRGERLGDAAVSPGWDPALVGSRVADIAFDGAGALYVRQGGRCVEVPVTGPIVHVQDGACPATSVMASSADSVEGVSLGPGEWLIEVPGLEPLLKLRAGACT